MSGGESVSETTQVVTFSLGGEMYCVPINYVAEIVKHKAVREIPNTAPYVKGVTDLRGEVTTIIDLIDVLNSDTSSADNETMTKQEVIVLDDEVGGTNSPNGWLVSHVNDVRSVMTGNVDTTVATDNTHIHGLLKPENESKFIIWVNAKELTV
jgi:purine-binding chemotaxis protein CheW